MKQVSWLLFGLVLTLSQVPAQAQETDEVNAEAEAEAQQQIENIVNACLATVVSSAEPNRTVAQLRSDCERQSTGIVEERRVFEKSVSRNPFAILPHRPNYLLPISYSNLNQTLYEPVLDGNDLDNVETKFQVSLKFETADDWLIEGLDLHFAMTATSWWQSYNSAISAPFRETNYEPELIFSYTKPWSLFGLPVKHGFVSLNHQSNGQSGALSRSWNRVIGGLTVEQGPVVWNAQVWWRIPEDAKTSPSDPGGDDNPDIEKFLGHGQLTALWRLRRSHNLEIKLRNNFRNSNKGSIELGWSYPFTNHLRGFIQYFKGYGESLIFYNESTERFSIGIKLTDWL